jgi:methylenetetrahydrofolate dehydrogenase (NADP+)/methenyltetrahydrofolate cyclohydrolase
LERNNVEFRGKTACVVGRSNIVGRPMSQMLLKKDATVIICHIHTQNLAEMTSLADILVVAVGKIALIRGEHIKPGATVVDVGINKVTDQISARELFDEIELERRLGVIERRGETMVGDVHPTEVLQVAGKYTPVPGGVGLLTVAMLMKNTLKAAKARRFKQV